MKKHISKGCLSGIPKSAGTSRNEAFHRVLNTHFSRISRIGIPLALALLTVLIYQHNCKIQEKVTGVAPIPFILLKEDTGRLNNGLKESFGVVSKSVSAGGNTDWINCKPNELEPKLDLTENQVFLTDEVAELITVPELIHVLKSACNLAAVADHMNKITANSPIFDPVLMPFMSSVSNIILRSHEDSILPLQHEHEKRLKDIISSFKLQLHPVAGDGNCFFSAIAYALKTNELLLLEHDPNFFRNKSVGTDDPGKVVMMLRELAINEWRSNANDYECFLTSSTVAEEAGKFLQSGYYQGELADTMPLALANSLQLVLTIFTSIRHHPIINITPRHIAVPVSLFLAYNQFGPGHYDGILIEKDSDQVSTEPQPQIEVNTVSCTCGKNDKKNSTHCHPKTRKYSTVCMCSCYNGEKGCSQYCKCKSCKNPLGRHTENRDAGSAQPQKRPRHNWQISIPKSATFALQKGEILNCGTRSLLEFFTLEQVLSQILKQGTLPTPNNIAKIYNAAVEVSATQEKNLPLGEMTLEKISTFLREHEYNLQYYKTVCVTRLHLEYYEEQAKQGNED